MAGAFSRYLPPLGTPPYSSYIHLVLKSCVYLFFPYLLGSYKFTLKSAIVIQGLSGTRLFTNFTAFYFELIFERYIKHMHIFLKYYVLVHAYEF